MFEPKIETFIRCCAMKKGTKDLEDLLAEGVNVNEFGFNNRTPLMETCLYNPEPSIVRFLLQNGADVKKRNRNGETALIVLGCSKKSGRDAEEVLSELIAYGADVNETDDNGYTGLHNAAINISNPDIINVFLKYGANLWQPDNKGITPAEKICYYCKDAQYVKECLKNVQDIQALFFAFVLNSKMAGLSGGWNKQNVEECIKIFLQKGLNINCKDKQGMSPLMSFCKNNSTDFIKKKSDGFWGKLTYGPSLIMVAEVIKILLKNGADPNLKNNQGETAFDMCNDKKELTDVLRHEK